MSGMTLLDRGYTLSEAYELWRSRAAGEREDERDGESDPAEQLDCTDCG